MPRKPKHSRRDESEEDEEYESQVKQAVLRGDDFDDDEGGDYMQGGYGYGEESPVDRELELDDEPRGRGSSRRKVEAYEDYQDDMELLEENRAHRLGSQSRLKKGRFASKYDDADFDDDDFIDDNTFGAGQMRDEGRSYFQDFYDTQRGGDDFERKVDLTQIYEPDEIKEKYATPEDERIKTLDMPERFQLRFKNRENPTNEELQEETIWIYHKFAYELFADLTRRVSKPDLMELIFKILNLIRVQNYEVMYIYSYEFLKEFPIDGFTLEHLWETYDLDMEWNSIYRKKNSIRKLLDIVENLNPIDPSIREHLDSCQDLASLQDLQDYVEYIMLKFKVETPALSGGGGYKKATKSHFVSEAIRYRLDELASQVAISPDELSHNMENDAKKIPNLKMPEFYTDLPEEAIKRYLDPSVSFLSNSLKCLYSIVGLMARDLYYHPIIRKILRKEYQELPIRLVTNPTEKGRKELDIYHPHFYVKRMRVEKPMVELSEDTWLVVAENERKGRIEVRFEFPWRDDDSQDLIKQNLMKLYLAPMRGLGPEELEITSKWNIFRSEVLKIFLDEYMYKYLEKWMRNKLTLRAERYVIKQCAKKFRNTINMQPYKGEGQRKGRVLAVMPESNRGPVSFAMVDINGEVLDRFVMHYLHHRQYPVNDHLMKEELFRERKRLKVAIERHRPQMVIIGAAFVEVFYMKQTLSGLVEELEDELKREKGFEPTAVWVDIADPSQALLYAKSEHSNKEFIDDTVQMRAAISLGRYQQDPLAETLNLWDEDSSKNLLLELRLHPGQNLVDQARLMNEYEKTAMEIVNTVGVDINLALKHHNLRGPLQFISGLGPRKAMYLIEKIIERCEVMLNFRFQLCSSKILSKNVYDNCAGFIKVRLLSRGDTNYDVLDGTRIHPIHYEITRRIAKILVRNASDRDDVVQRIMENPHTYLANLDERRRFVEFESMKSKWNWEALISYIRDELTHPYQDNRPKMANLDAQSIDSFYALTKENQENFREGTLVTARVTKIFDQVTKTGEKREGVVMCRLDCGIMGTIHPNDLNTRASDIKIGIYVRARIKKIVFKTLHVYLSLKDVSDHDHFYAIIHSRLKSVGCEVIRVEDFPVTFELSATTTTRFRPRNIRHNMFKNISITKAMDFLTNREIGAFVIRPSSKGLDHLSITWKFFEGVFVHLDIKEEDKAPGATISNKLRIGNEIYQDLDEIIKMYIEPCNALMRHIVRHKKFYRGPLDRMEDTLREDRKSNPKVNAYYFCSVPQAPHYVLLCYLNSQANLVTEFIKVKPRGLFFHEQFFPNLQEVITWMKQNFYSEAYQRFVKKAKLPLLWEASKPLVAEPPPMLRDRSGRERYGSARRRGGELECHYCKKPGHRIPDCPVLKEKEALREERRVKREDRGISGGRISAGRFGGRASAGRVSAGRVSAGRQSAGRVSTGRQSIGRQSAGRQSAGRVSAGKQSRGRAGPMGGFGSVDRSRSRGGFVDQGMMMGGPGYMNYNDPWSLQNEMSWGGYGGDQYM